MPLEVPARLSPEALERRRMPRGKCHHTAWVITPDEVFCECVITDMSRLGARIKLAPTASIPTSFLLMAPEFVLEAKLIWRKGGQAGVTTKPFV